MSNKYQYAKQEDLDKYLHELVSNMTTDQILSYPEVRSFFMEELNNEILTLWENRDQVRLYMIQEKYHELFPGRKSQDEFKNIFVKLLAEAIQAEGEFDSFEILGPFGLMCNYLIDFKKGDNKYYFSFFEQSLEGEIGRHTSKTKSNFTYEKGTIGYYNQGNLDKIVIDAKTTIAELIHKYVTKDE
jgi:hypothetical protein